MTTHDLAVEHTGMFTARRRDRLNRYLAAYVISCVPLAILFSFLMRYYVQGLTSGALKL